MKNNSDSIIGSLGGGLSYFISGDFWKSVAVGFTISVAMFFFKKIYERFFSSTKPK